MFWVVVALFYFVLAAVAPSVLGLFVNRARADFRSLSLSLRVVFVAIALICLAATSYVRIESDEIAVLNKIYGTTSLPGQHIIATNGEKGPQAEILTPGWHPWFLVNVIYQVENKKVVSIPSGEYGFLNAKDGVPLRPDQFLADAFPPEHVLDMLDAEYFLTHGGQRGPQTTALTPGNYRLNTYLWDLSVFNAVDVVEGFVGVVKSNIVDSVHFGNLVADKPASCQQKMVSTNASGEAIAAQEAKSDEGKLTAILVPVGCIGIWEKALQPGRYYANEAAYKITMMSTRVQTWEFKGGYKRRYIDLSLDQAGNLTQTQRSQDVPVPPGSADPAISPFVEGWLVPLELRVLAQVTPDNAPFVVASVGGLPEIENNIMVPTIRSIVRNVVGAQGRHVLDLADNRAALEHAVEDAIRPEGLRAGIVIKEVKFGDPALPPELLVSRLRQQLADQLQVTYQQEQKAQTQRIETEKARETAEQQHQLVEAVIGVQVSEQNRNAAKLRGEGQKLELEEIAQGQRAQANVLGQDRVLTITLVQQLLKTIEEKPEIVSERPYVAHSAPAPDKTVRLIVPIQKLESLTIDATADRDETDRRIVHPLSGRALLDRNSLPRWPANGEREPVAGRCVLTQVARPTKPQARAFFVGGHSGWSVQINSERHIWEIKIIGVKGIYNIFSLIFEFPNKIRNRHHI